MRQQVRIHPLYYALGEAFMARGLVGLNKLCRPGETLEISVGEWTVEVNPHPVSARTCSGVELEPFCFWIEFNGWPAGLVHREGGQIAAGELANEQTLLAALRAPVEGKEVVS